MKKKTVYYRGSKKKHIESLLHPNGETAVKNIYDENGLRLARSTFSESGNIKSCTHYDDKSGIIISKSTYYENGDRKSKVDYIRDTKIVKERLLFKNNTLSESREYYECGKLFAISTYINDTKNHSDLKYDCKKVCYHKNGVIGAIRFIKDHNLLEETVFDENKVKLYKDTYDIINKKKKTIHFDPDGSIRKRARRKK